MDYRDSEAGYPPKFTVIREASSLSQRALHSRIRIETMPKKLAVAPPRGLQDFVRTFLEQTVSSPRVRGFRPSIAMPPQNITKAGAFQ
jgi:hypothetical protein